MFHRYYAKAKVDPSGFCAFNTETLERCIRVNSIVDLNRIQGAEKAQTGSITKTFGYLCCRSTPLSATVRVPRYGYCPGEAILISAEIKNLTTKIINSTTASLIQDVFFRASCGTHSEKIERILGVRTSALIYNHILTHLNMTILSKCKNKNLVVISILSVSQNIQLIT